MKNKLSNLSRASSNNKYPIPYLIRLFSYVLAVTLTTAGIGYYLVFAANTTIGNNISTSGNLTVGGSSSLASLTLSGGLNASSTLQVTATSTFYSVVGIGTTSPGALLAIQGNALISGNLNVANITATGTLTAANILATGSTTLQNFTAGNSTTTNATSTYLTVTGSASTSRLTVSNTSSFGGLVNLLNGFINFASSTFASALNVSGLANFSSLSTFSGGLLSTASSTFSGNLSISGPLSASSTLNVGGLAYLSGFISSASSTVSSSLHVSGVLRASSSVAFGSNFVIDSSGNVGIGTTSPRSNLHVVNGGAGVLPAGNTIGTFENNTSVYVSLLTPDAYESGILFGNVLSAAAGGVIYNGSAVANGMQFRVNGNSTKMVIDSSGNVGIGTTSPAQTLAVQGNALFSGNISSVANITATGTLTVANASTTGMLTVGNGFISSASSTVAANLQVAGAIQASSTISANRIAIGTGTSTFTGGVETGTLGVTGTSTLAGLSAGFGTFSGNLIGSGNLNITGTSTLAGLSASFGTFSSNLVTSGSLSATNLATLSGGLLSTASSTFSGNLLISGPLSASSTLNVGGLAYLSGFISSASSTISNSLNISGPLSASSTLTVAGNSILSGFISNSSSTISSLLNVSGPLNASSTLLANGLSTLYGGFISSASSTIASSLHIAGNLQASSSVSLATTTITVNFASTSSGIPLTLRNTQSATNTQNRLAFQIAAVATTSPGEVIEATTTAAITSILTRNYNPASGNLIFSTLNSGILGEAGRFTDLGYLGIGTTTPGALLAVQGNALFSGNLTSVANITATGTLSLTGTSGTSTIASGQGFTIGTSQFVVVGSNGKVGIGTTSPSDTLTISKASIGGPISALIENTDNTNTASHANLSLRAGGASGGNPKILMTVSGATDWIMGVDNADSDKFKFGPTNALSSANTLTLTTDGNVGIGTTTPGALLAVQGTGLFTGTLTAPNIIATGTLNVTGLTTLSNASTTQISSTGAAYFATVSGRVGIGTASPDADTQLSINAASLTAGLAFRNSNVTKAYIGVDITPGNVITGSSADDMILRTGTNLLFSVGSVEKLRLASSGNVGIGTTTPGALLAVQGTGLFTGTLTAPNIIATGTLNVTGVTTLTNASTTGRHDFGSFISSASSTISSNLLVSGVLNASSSLVVANGGYFGGNVGIGTTSPGSLLSVHGNALFSGNISSVANITATGTLSLTGTTGTSTIASGQGFTVGTSQFVVQQTSGNVGIGTASPGASLDVAGSALIGSGVTGSNILTIGGAPTDDSAAYLRFVKSNAVKSWQIAQNHLAIGLEFIPSTINGGLTFTTPAMVILDGGNVGIGTTTPGALLAVQGTGLFTGTLTAPNIIATGTLNVTGLTTLGNASTTQISSTGAAYFATVSGNVGIGTTSPAQLFSVQGNTYFSGTSFFGGALTATSSVNLATAGGNLALGAVAGFSDVPIKLANPADLPAGTGNGASFSPDGTYLAIAHDTTPFVTIYKRSGDTFTKLANPADLPAGTGVGASFSPDGTYLAIAHATTPFVTIYKRSGDTFTKLTNPTNLPADAGFGASFSPDGTYLAIVHSTTPFITIYKRSGDTFTKLTNPTDLPAGRRGASFSPDGTYLALAHSTTPFVTIYKRSGDTFTKLTNPTDLPADAGFGASFSPDGTYLAIAHDVTPFITIYKRSGDTFTKLANPADLPAGAGVGASFSPDGTYLTIAHATTPFVTIYKRSGDTFTKLANPADLPAGAGNGASFSPDGTYLAIAHTVSPFVTIYKGSGAAIHKLEFASATSTDQGLGFGKEIKLYRSAPNTLALSSGNSFSILFGNLYMGSTASTSVVIDSERVGYFTKIAIGTTSPSQLLSVHGNALFSGNITSVANITATGTLNVTGVTTLSNASTTGRHDFGSFISSASSTVAGPLHISGVLRASSTVAFGSDDFVLDSNGSVGIGTTTPGALLAVQGNALIAGTTTVRALVATSSSLTVGGSNFVVDASGNVGIGQTTPTETLHIKSETSANIAFEDTTSGIAGYIGPAANNQSSASTNYLGLRGESGISWSVGSLIKAVLDSSGNFGIGTTTPSQLLSVHGNAFFSGNLTNVANITATGTLNVTGTSGTSTIGSITIGGNGMVGIGTSSPTFNFEVATRTIAFNSGADGDLGVWATSSNTFSMRNGHSSITANGYVYMLGGLNGLGSPINAVQYAKLNSDGSVGSWATSTNTFSARRTHTSVIANGYVYVLGGEDTSGNKTNTLQFAKLNSDGSVGPWTTSANSFVNRTNHSSVIANGYVYVLGGNSGVVTNTVQYAKLNSDGTIGSWATSTNSFAARFQHSSITANGYIYVLGGSDGTSSVTNTVQYAKLNSDGSTGVWATSTNNLPAVRQQHSSVIANGYVYVLGGTSPATVLYAKLNSDGTTGSWVTSANIFAARNSHSSVIANGYVYVLGGNNGAGLKTGTVQYSSTARILISGNLDLLGLASTTLGDFGDSTLGSVGGSIFAGNIFSAGQLEVTGGTQLWGGLSVGGMFSLTASTSALQTASIFSIQNATGTSPLFTIQYDGNVGIGTTTPGALLAVHGNALIAGTTTVRALVATSSSLTVGGSNFVVDASGKVGIGTAGPSAFLHLAASAPVLRFQNTPDTNYGGGLRWSNSNDTAKWALGPYINIAANDMEIADGANTRIIIKDSSGNVGIGTTSPAQLLAVSGNVYIHSGATQRDLRVDNGSICADNNGAAKCTAALTAGTVYGDTGTFAASDIAENYPITDESIEAGDIVSLSAEISSAQTQERNTLESKNNKNEDDKAMAEMLTTSLVKATPENSVKIIGAISTNPGVVLGDTTGMTLNAKIRPVALGGRIPVKVNLEGGEIAVGDSITISSVPGVGKKATSAGKTIGYALENYSGQTAQNGGKVLVFASLGNYQEVEPPAGSGGSTSQLLAQAVDAMKAWLEGMQVFIENGLVRLKNLVAETVTADRAVLNKVELKDEDTGDTYCVRMKNGALLSTLGECASAVMPDSNPAPGNASSSLELNIDSESPVITLNGPSIIEIETGTAWVDPGATVTDNVNDNLGIYYSVDGVPTGNQGNDLPQSVIDTSVSGSYTITYSSTDQAGNIGTTNRTLTVIDSTVSTATSTPQ